jgi:hypothetical protein
MRYAILLLVAGPLVCQDKADPAKQLASMTWLAGPRAAATGRVERRSPLFDLLRCMGVVSNRE